MYSVYIFNFPDGTKFCGVTKQDVRTAWGVKGKGLKSTNPALYKKIQECGWDNLQWDVVAENVSKDVAYRWRNERREKYMEQGIWFKERKQILSPEEVLNVFEREMRNRLNSLEYAPSEFWVKVVQDIQNELLPEVTAEVWHLLNQ